jgi:hypothetical protein
MLANIRRTACGVKDQVWPHLLTRTDCHGAEAPRNRLPVNRLGIAKDVPRRPLQLDFDSAMCYAQS